MKTKKTETKQEIAIEALNLNPDEENKGLTGIIDGFPLIAVFGSQDIDTKNNVNLWNIIFSVKKQNNEEIESKEFRELQKNTKSISNIDVNGNRLVVNVKSSSNREKEIAFLRESIAQTINFLKENNFIPCCEESQSESELTFAVVGGVYCIISEEVFLGLKNQSLENQRIEEDKVENIPLGILGAIIGSFIGAIVQVLIGKMGYVAVISGLAMGFLSMFGYNKLAGKMSIKGTVISLIIVFIMTYIGDRFLWAWLITEEIPISLMDAFNHIYEIIEADTHYFVELVKVYIYALIGAIPTALAYLSSEKQKNITYKL